MMNLYVYSGYGPYMLVQAADVDQAVLLVQKAMARLKLPQEDIDYVPEMTQPLELPDGPGVVVEWWG